jgi:hypothetical protein
MHRDQEAGTVDTIDSPGAPLDLVPRPTVTIDELLAGTTARQAMKTAESLSSATFERLTIDGERFIVKYLHCDDDWVMRATGDLMCRPQVMWTSGLYDALPAFIDATVAGCATGLGRNGWGAALLMHDVGEHLIPDGDFLIDADVHERNLDNMAAMHAHFWGFHDTVGLTPTGNRIFALSPWTALAEAELGSGELIPRLVGEGWRCLPEVSPRAGGIALDLLADVTPLLNGLDAQPQTLVHGDWKLGNLGLYPDGRSILLDWAFPGAAPACADLAWYLGVNCARMPISKDDAIDLYRAALERHGVATDGWWDAQLGLCLIGHFLQMGWNKAANGRDDEFTWWEERVIDAERYLP